MRPLPRNEMQKSADKFDLDLFRLLSAAHDFSQTGPRKYRGRWSEIAEHLHHARPIVRSMMHKEDIERTTPNARHGDVDGDAAL